MFRKWMDYEELNGANERSTAPIKRMIECIIIKNLPPTKGLNKGHVSKSKVKPPIGKRTPVDGMRDEREEWGKQGGCVGGIPVWPGLGCRCNMLDTSSVFGRLLVLFCILILVPIVRSQCWYFVFLGGKKRTMALTICVGTDGCPGVCVCVQDFVCF